MDDFVKRLKFWQAFKNVAILFSFILNLGLVVAVLLILPQIKPLITGTVKPLVGGLHGSFVEMNQASIKRTISVQDSIPIEFTVPLDTTSTVILSEDVVLGDHPITMVLPGGGGYINGNVTLVLPAGLELPVAMALGVPVKEDIPLDLQVAVEIPLRETELSGPFSRLEGLFGPLVDQMDRYFPEE
jgi:hypothetical protein